MRQFTTAGTGRFINAWVKFKNDNLTETVLTWHGKSGLRKIVGHHIALADKFQELVEQTDGIHLFHRACGLVCFYFDFLDNTGKLTRLRVEAEKW